VVILYTAFLDNELVRRAEDAGIAACLGKTEGLEVLEREIRGVCGSLF
jgi:DNA-binding NarL/FixJ family response regulator